MPGIPPAPPQNQAAKWRKLAKNSHLTEEEIFDGITP